MKNGLTIILVKEAWILDPVRLGADGSKDRNTEEKMDALNKLHINKLEGSECYYDE